MNHPDADSERKNAQNSKKKAECFQSRGRERPSCNDWIGGTNLVTNSQKYSTGNRNR